MRNLTTKNGITLVALVVTLVVLLILAGVTINLLFSDTGLFQKAQGAKNTWEDAERSDRNAIGELANELDNIINGTGNGEENPTDEEETVSLPADGSYSELMGVNTPDIEDGVLTPIVWNKTANNGTGAWVKTESNSNWYSYTTTEKKWANAVVGGTFNEDGTLDESATGYSMFVWIPRFAYQISSGYHQSGADINPDDGANSAGTINVKFMNGTGYESADGEKTQESDWDNASGEGNWNIHPAFSYFEDNRAISGIWVAKFEASHTGCTTQASTGETDTDNINLTLQVKPGVTSWRNITIGNVFTVCKNYSTSLNSHMMKNSEWGAVAYLSQSSYGKNNEIWINPNSHYITGQAGTNVSASATTTTYSYSDTTYGVNASTTGTIYGIYDMSGGNWEYIAAYVNNESNNLNTNGNSLVNNSPNYMKEIYNIGEEDTSVSNYEANSDKYGDAIYEK